MNIKRAHIGDSKNEEFGMGGFLKYLKILIIYIFGKHIKKMVMVLREV